MSAFILCIANDRMACFGRVGLVDGVLRRIEATTDLIAVIDEELARVTAKPMARMEVAGPQGRGYDFREVTPDDPRLLDVLAKSFRSRGYTATLHDARRAEAWSLLRRLPLELDIRDTLSPGLDAMPEEDITDLLALMRDAVREVDELAAAAQKERDEALAAQAKVHDAEIAALAAEAGAVATPPGQT